MIYFLRKKLARHRLAVTAALGFILLLAALAVTSYMHVSRARDAAEAARVKAGARLPARTQLMSSGNTYWTRWTRKTRMGEV